MKVPPEFFSYFKEGLSTSC